MPKYFSSHHNYPAELAIGTSGLLSRQFWPLGSFFGAFSTSTASVYTYHALQVNKSTPTSGTVSLKFRDCTDANSKLSTFNNEHLSALPRLCFSRRPLSANLDQHIPASRPCLLNNRRDLPAVVARSPFPKAAHIVAIGNMNMDKMMSNPLKDTIGSKLEKFRSGRDKSSSHIRSKSPESSPKVSPTAFPLSS